MLKSLLIAGIISFISLSLVSFNSNPFQDIKKGKEVYGLYCQNCHMEKGEGIPELYPPLAKTNYLKDAKKMIGIILKGQSGEITVKGKKYNVEMPAQDYLTDEQIADVLNYVRNSWGNKYPLITKAQVKAVRK